MAGIVSWPKPDNDGIPGMDGICIWKYTRKILE
jgi:hypothetical protein